MTNENLDDLECGGLPSLDTLRLLAEWGPVIAKLQAVLGAPTPHEKAQAFVKFALAISTKTKTEADDKALRHLAAILNTSEGAAFADWCASIVGGLA